MHKAAQQYADDSWRLTLLREAAEEVLKSKGVDYVVIEKERFYIRPGQQSHLNRLAERLYKQSKTQLIFDPLGLAQNKVGAYYEPTTPILALDYHTVINEELSRMFIHEYRHLYAHNYGRGLPLLLDSVSSQNNEIGLISAPLENDAYSNHFSLDEFFTHARDIPLLASALDQAQSAEEVRRRQNDLAKALNRMAGFHKAALSTVSSLVNQQERTYPVKVWRLGKRLVVILPAPRPEAQSLKLRVLIPDRQFTTQEFDHYLRQRMRLHQLFQMRVSTHLLNALRAFARFRKAPLRADLMETLREIRAIERLCVEDLQGKTSATLWRTYGN